MKTYQVSMTERHVTEIEATSREEAIALAKEHGFNGNNYCLCYTAKPYKPKPPQEEADE